LWYCAHAIFHYRYEGQTSITVHENVYLIEAPSPDEALLEAKRLASEYEQVGEDSFLEIEGVRAEYRFSGIRKLIAIQPDGDSAAGNVCSGSEVTYSVFEVDSLQDVESLASGDSTVVVYRE